MKLLPLSFLSSLVYVTLASQPNKITMTELSDPMVCGTMITGTTVTLAGYFFTSKEDDTFTYGK